jgi:hypothetical protein
MTNNYSVRIDSDELDKSGRTTCGRLLLDGAIASWSIGPVNNNFVPEEENGGWGSRFDFPHQRESGLQVSCRRRGHHHPERCECDPCEERHRRQAVSIVAELRQEGLTVEPSVPVQLKELGL